MTTKEQELQSDDDLQLGPVWTVIKVLGLDITPQQMTNEDYAIMSMVVTGQLFGPTIVASPAS